MIKNKIYGVCRARRSSSSALVVIALMKGRKCKFPLESLRRFIRPEKQHVNNLGPERRRRDGAVSPSRKQVRV